MYVIIHLSESTSNTSSCRRAAAPNAARKQDNAISVANPIDNAKWEDVVFRMRDNLEHSYI